MKTNSKVNAHVSFKKETPGAKKKNEPTPGSTKGIKSQQKPVQKNAFPINKGEKPVRIWSLMWLEQVGQCIFIEYENDIIIVDAWMEFATNETLGVDYIIPDISYIKKHRKKLRGIVLSHWHLDHVWALRNLLPDLGFPTIYTTPLTLWIVKKSFDNKHDIKKIKSKMINPDEDILKLGCFTIEFAYVNHNIPETYAMAIHTPKGTIFNSADFKIDHTPAIGEPADLAKIARVGVEWVKLYIWDSLGAWKTETAPSEREIGDTLDHTVEQCDGRIIIATFSSNVWRVIQLINSAIKYDRIVYISWRSLINNVTICQELWYIKAPKKYIRKLSSIDNLPDKRVMILCTWAQGEEFSALARMARKEHRDVSLQAGDTVLVSASVIPWNEAQAMEMKDNLVEQGVNLITNDMMDVHTSGHGWAEDHKLMLNLLKPQYFLPYYLNSYFRYQHRKLGLQVWIPDEHILMPNKNGSIIEMYENGCRIADKRLKIDTVLIDGKWRGQLAWEYVVKARHIMASDGCLNLIFKVDSDSKDLVWNIQIESRGFVYSGEVRDVHTKIVAYAKSKYYAHKKKKLGTKDIMKRIKDDLSSFIEKTVWRSPMVIPMYVYISTDGSDDTTKKPAPKKVATKKPAPKKETPSKDKSE